MPSVLITGGAKRVGALTARRFAAAGWRVLIHANQSRLEAEALARALAPHSDVDCVFTADLSNAKALDGLMDAAFAKAPDLCVLVNNASLFEYDCPNTVDADVWARAMAVNAYAPAYLSARFAARFTQASSASIINILDQKLSNLNPDYFSYTASKAALASITAMQAMHFAPRVRVYGVAPGLTLPSGDQTDADFAASLPHNLLERPPHPDELTDTIFFAATGTVASGEVFYVDSGLRFLRLHRDVIFLKRADGDNRKNA